MEFNPGDVVWVVERDEERTAVDVGGYILLATVKREDIAYAIVSPSVNDHEDLIFIMESFVSDTCIEYPCEVFVYPIEDVFIEKELAKAKLNSEA